VDEVASQVGRATSTVRGWLARGELKGYKLNGGIGALLPLRFSGTSEVRRAAQFRQPLVRPISVPGGETSHLLCHASDAPGRFFKVGQS
jgi:hypothetical protein